MDDNLENKKHRVIHTIDIGNVSMEVAEEIVNQLRRKCVNKNTKKSFSFFDICTPDITI